MGFQQLTIWPNMIILPTIMTLRNKLTLYFFFFFWKRRDYMSNSDPGLNLLDKSLTFGGGIP
jgi:hypothetical protein